ncbi:hypothetical protein F4802DRAFT_581385 [Xylaria palmicola]|nr:hypothetical protein F4802DRAFT_581385 [Xylaria palmicola]
MSCSCRTKPLRVFIQSFTGLRVTDPAIPRPVRLYRPSPAPFRQVPLRHPYRSFSSASTAYFLGVEAKNDVDSPARVAGEEPSDPTPDAPNLRFADVTNYGSPTLPQPAPGDNITVAKQHGVILDYSPESIDALVENLNVTSMAEKEAIAAGRGSVTADARSKSLPRSKPPIVSSQLKRRKIVKDDARRQPNAETAWVPQKEQWQIQKQALKEKFPDGWCPRKRLSPDALDGIRALHRQFPEQYTTEVLAKHFEVSVESIRRILRSKWTPSPEEDAARQERWFNRGKKIWSQMAELGKKPPRKWRAEGIVRKPHWNQKKNQDTSQAVPQPRRPAKAEHPKTAESVVRRMSGSIL